MITQHFDIEKGFANKEDLLQIFNYLSSDDAHYDKSGEIRYLGYNEFLDKDVVAKLEAYSRRAYSYIQEKYGYTLDTFNPNKVHVEIIESGSGFMNSYDMSRSGEIGIFMLINKTPEVDSLSFNGVKPEEFSNGDMVFFTEGEGFVKNMNPSSSELYTMVQWFQPIV